MDTGITIRQATEEDCDQVIAMSAQFYEVSGYSEHIPFCANSCAQMFHGSQLQGMCFVAECRGRLVGFVLGMIFPSLVNKDYLVGAEMAWWVDPEYRGQTGLKLLRAIENEAKEQGAKVWSMMALENQNPDMAEAIYLKAGYTKTERTFSRFH